jgi:hypothetical protein
VTAQLGSNKHLSLFRNDDRLGDSQITRRGNQRKEQNPLLKGTCSQAPSRVLCCPGLTAHSRANGARQAARAARLPPRKKDLNIGRSGPNVRMSGNRCTVTSPPLSCRRDRQLPAAGGTAQAFPVATLPELPRGSLPALNRTELRRIRSLPTRQSRQKRCSREDCLEKRQGSDRTEPARHSAA